MPLVKVAGEEIHYTHSGSDDEITFVLIHGSGGDHAHWPQNLRAYPGADVYTLDLPGHGRSGGSGRNSVSAYADFITAFIQKLELRKVAMFGHSLGGAIAQTIALRQPGWLASIVLVGTGARLRVEPAILDGLFSDFQETIDLLCQRSFSSTAMQELVENARKGFLNTPAEVTHGDLSACDQFDIMEEVGKITCPTLVVSSSEDRLTPVKYGQYLQNRIPGARLAVITGAGHMMALENNAEFMRVIESFF